MRTEAEVSKLADRFARRLDIETPDVRIVPARGRDVLRIRLHRGVLVVPEPCLDELTEGELSFAIALAFGRHAHLDLWGWPLFLLPWLVGFSVGYMVISFFRSELLNNFWLAYGILLGLTVIGYLVGLVLASKNRVRVRDNVFAEALALTGSPHAAEAYLIRSQAGDISSARRRTLTGKDKDFLATQLDALDAAARSLGIEYRSVVD